ncbi:hypothetical protein RchiOBHm_Chr2g0091581 [Rosa chinensis]|uniref:Uncharacterized protein n=1 Tax=Rosa chinensis TaxID=74649 RepID=A0A2P6RJS8_ROSCH|nr:hypothetical protein RchiOBHm_Chr2g0091581 [Rosa chinensis]
MEVEPSPPVVAKKLWNLVRIVFFMLRKGLTKSKLLVDLHLMLKRGKLASKAIANNLIMLHHSSNSAFSCRSNDAVSFVTPVNMSSAAATALPPTTLSFSTTSATSTTTTTDTLRKILLPQPPRINTMM